MIERQLSRSSRAPRSGRPSSGGARRADLELAPKESLLWTPKEPSSVASSARASATTSGYTGPPFRWLQVRLAPVGSFIIVTEPLGKDVCDQLLPTRRMASDSKNLLYYVRITPDRRLLFGGRARFAKAGPRSGQKSGRILRDAMVSVFPQLEQARVDYSWGGPVDMSMDRLVHAREQDGLFYSVAYSGHGVQMATHMGKQMADYMDTEANPWRPGPSGRHRRVYCQLL